MSKTSPSSCIQPASAQLFSRRTDAVRSLATVRWMTWAWSSWTGRTATYGWWAGLDRHTESSECEYRHFVSTAHTLSIARLVPCFESAVRLPPESDVRGLEDYERSRSVYELGSRILPFSDGRVCGGAPASYTHAGAALSLSNFAFLHSDVLLRHFLGRVTELYSIHTARGRSSYYNGYILYPTAGERLPGELVRTCSVEKYARVFAKVDNVTTNYTWSELNVDFW